MSKLTKLTIKKFRNVAPTTLEFRPGLNVLLGKNAAGKTTLLRLLSTTARVREEALKDDELEVNYRVSAASLDFEHTIARTRGNELSLPRDPGGSLVEEFPSFQQTDHFVVEKNGGIVLKADVFPNEVILEKDGRRSRIDLRVRTKPIFAVLLSLSKAYKDSALEELEQEILYAQIASAGRMDESLERFGALLAARREDSGSGPKWTSAGIPHSMHQIPPGPLEEGTSATFPLQFLERVARVLGYDSAHARFDVERLSPEPGRHIVRLSNLRFFFKRPGEEISHDLLSYGQKRLLTFFAHVDASPDVVIADELVNGLHHEWISACLEEIGDRQAFLTSQNPLLLDFLRFDSAEEVRRTFILCERENRENGAQLIWRNPTQEEAESFFAAYQTGIQRVSDILLTKGLW